MVLLLPQSPIPLLSPAFRFRRHDRSPFLCDKLRIIMLPTVACVLRGKVKDYIVGFDDMGGSDEFDTEVLEWRLGETGILDYTGALEGPPQVEKKTSYIGKTKQRATRDGWDDDSDDDF